MTYKIETNNGELILSGTLDYAAINASAWEQSKMLLGALASPIKINLAHIEHSDSTGVALLIGWARLARKQNKMISFTHIPEQMREIIRVSGLEKMLPIDA
jgi:phospholipid transport system transporter-binding protein